mgnify:FL=1
MSEDIIPERPALPEDLKDTEAHMIMSNMGLIATQLERIPDMLSGGNRTRHFGAWLSLNVLPNLDEQLKDPNAPLLLPEPPPVLLVADSLDQLRERLVFEIDIMINTTQDYMDGKIELNADGIPIRTDGDTNGNNITETATADSSS